MENIISEVWESILSFDLKKALIIVLSIFIIVLGIFIILMVFDKINNYDDCKLFKNKLKRRMGTRKIGGGEEFYFRYWVWQRNKRKHVINILSSLNYYNRYYPKEKWRQKGLVKFPFRRECWINNSNVDKDVYKDWQKKCY